MDTGVKDRKKWTPEEDALLMQAMKRFRYLQDVRWTEVAAIIPDRTPKACRKRWVNGLNGRLKKGSWSADEDERLRQGVAMLSSDWARIAEHVGQRSGDQCSKRWREVLDPAINKSAWTPEEDKLLTELYQMHGSAWQIISTSFNNRRALQCRNRCCKLLGLHGTPRFAATPSFDTESDNNGVSSGDLSKTATSAPVSPFRLAFSALPTPMTPLTRMISGKETSIWIFPKMQALPKRIWKTAAQSEASLMPPRLPAMCRRPCIVALSATLKTTQLMPRTGALHQRRICLSS